MYYDMNKKLYMYIEINNLDLLSSTDYDIAKRGGSTKK